MTVFDIVLVALSVLLVTAPNQLALLVYLS